MEEPEAKKNSFNRISRQRVRIDDRFQHLLLKLQTIQLILDVTDFLMKLFNGNGLNFK